MAAVKYWPNDALGRSEDGDFLERFLVARSQQVGGSFVLNIDAGWGRGKSYFLKCFGDQLEGSGHLVARVNAWETDHAQDPLLAVMAAIEDCLKPFTNKKAIRDKLVAVQQNVGSIAWAGAKGLATGLAKRYAGEVVDEVADLLGAPPPPKSEGKGSRRTASVDAAEAIVTEIESIADRAARAAIDGFRQAESSIAAFKANMSALIQAAQKGNVQPPFFVLIDELDRCRPTYALEMLERTKHLFSMDGVIFVIATDTAQMKESIKAVYGAGFDSGRYLHRFFDRTYVFEEPTLDAFLTLLRDQRPLDESKLSVPSHWASVQEAILVGLGGFDISLRDFEQCYDLLHTIQTMWNKPYKLELLALLPLIVARQLGYSASYVEAFRSLQESQKASRPRMTFGHRGPGPYRLTALETMNLLAEKASKGWPEVGRATEVRNEFEGWIAERMRHEYQQRRGDAADMVIPWSITDYPALVMMAGRIRDE